MATADRKLYLGPRLRVLRRELGLNQTRMAEELGVSPSYLNHLERNQRPLTTQMLLRLAHAYDIDIKDFVVGAREAARTDLHEVFADPALRDLAPPRHELMELAENLPGAADALVRLYRALEDQRQAPQRLETAEASGLRLASPLGWLRDVLDAHHNHFPALDGAAEAVSLELSAAGPEALRGALVERLHARHAVEVRVEESAGPPGRLRFYDYHRRRLLLSERLPASGRLFALAYQLAFQELGEAIGALVEKDAPPGPEAAVLARIALTNYAAAALVMPYGRFHAAAEGARYDLDLLAARFGASLEQVCHRLTTLNRPSARGVPFFMLKIDRAGNVSKRFAAETRALVRAGGGCPRWRIHEAWMRPGETVVDQVETPDGESFLTLARAAPRVGSALGWVVVLGCEARYAPRILYGDEARPLNPIGPACHLCERAACRERALPPLTRPLQLHQYERTAQPYPFRTAP